MNAASNSQRIVVTCLLLALTPSQSPAQEPLSAIATTRTWTDDTGKHRTEGALVEVSQCVVTLERPDGQLVEVSLARLSQADQQLLKLALPDAVATPSSVNQVKTADGWREFRPGDGSFRISMPAEPAIIGQVAVFPYGIARSYTAISETDSRRCMVGYGDLPELPKETTPHQFFERYVATYVRGMQQDPGAKLVRDVPITFKGLQGRQVEMEEQRADGIYIHCRRFYPVGGDIYDLDWVQRQGAGTADRQRFFESFELGDQAPQQVRRRAER